MNYMLMISSDGVSTEEKRAAMQAEMPGYVAEMDRRGLCLFGRELMPPTTAATVRVREGETLVSDGPFAETKEYVAGMDLIECEDLDAAIEVAAAHPVARFNPIEVRPLLEGFEYPESARDWATSEPGDSYLLFMCVDGIPGPDDVKASLASEGRAWASRQHQRGVYVAGWPLGHADTATTVRVRGGDTLMSDGPFIEAKEFIGGFGLLQGVSRDEAIQIAAEHPLARHHRVEVRRFVEQ
jgi:hypothetical protein